MERSVDALPIEGVTVEAAENEEGVVVLRRGLVAGWQPDGAVLELDHGLTVGRRISLRLLGVDASVLPVLGVHQDRIAGQIDIETHVTVTASHPMGDGVTSHVEVRFYGNSRILGRSHPKSKEGISRSGK
jgi:hypothetical protein